MKEKILNALKTKFKNLGFGDKAFEGVSDYLATTVTEESAIETAIAGVEPLLKSFQGDIDKRVSDAVAKVKAEKEPGGGADPNKKEPTDPNEPAWFKTYREQNEATIKTLTQKLEAKEKAEKQSTLRQRVIDKLNEGKSDGDKAILKGWLDGRTIDIETEDQIDQLVSSQDEKFTAFKQDLVNQGVVVDVPADSGAARVKDTEALAKQISDGTKEIVEQQKK